jgi:hypothetical protein
VTVPPGRLPDQRSPPRRVCVQDARREPPQVNGRAAGICPRRRPVPGSRGRGIAVNRRAAQVIGAPRTHATVAFVSRQSIVVGRSSIARHGYIRPTKPPIRQAQSLGELRTIPIRPDRKIGPRTAKARIETSARPLFGPIKFWSRLMGSRFNAGIEVRSTIAAPGR